MTRLSALRATGLLRDFAPMLAVADVHVAQRLGALTGEGDDRVLLAVALTVRGTRLGSVVLDLADAAATIALEPDGEDEIDVSLLAWPDVDGWAAACAVSPLITGTGGGPPLRMAGTRLWLDRYWHQEAQVAEDLLRHSAARPDDLDPAVLRHDLDDLFATDSDADQRRAVAVAALSRVSVIAGGPGTGKTTTVARLLAVMLRQRPSLRIALAAPTGKAAARLEEAVRGAAGPLRPDDRAALGALTASTLHRLLGSRPGLSSRFRHDRGNHLPYDLVVVDEGSMVSLTLMARLVEALAPTTRLVLVGDPDQLTSVEAGAVLGDLVDADDVGPVTTSFGAALDEAGATSQGGRDDDAGASLRESVTLLRTVHRFDARGTIDQLAHAIRSGRADDVLVMLRAAPDGLQFLEAADDEPITGDVQSTVRRVVVAHETAVITAARAGDGAAALTALEQHRLLCAHRAGLRGVRHWSTAVERWLATDPGVDARSDGRYAGQPLIVTSNDYETGLYNGDTGVVIQHGDDLVAAFRRGDDLTLVPLTRLADVRALHAITVHRAQGSQFETVTVLLPPAASPLATRQLLYTAVTRAASTVLIVGSAEALQTCVNKPIARATGLRDRLAGRLGPAT